MFALIAVVAVLGQTSELTQRAADRFNLSASGGLSVYSGPVRGFALDPGSFIELTAHASVPHFAVGIAVSAGSGTLRPEDTTTLGDLPRSYWLASLAVSAETRWSLVSGRLSPFICGRLGWELHDFRSSALTHGPVAGVSFGIDFRPWLRSGLHIGISATPTIALVSSANMPRVINGYTVRGDTRWGDSFIAMMWSSFAIRLGYSF